MGIGFTKLLKENKAPASPGWKREATRAMPSYKGARGMRALQGQGAGVEWARSVFSGYGEERIRREVGLEADSH